MPVLGQGLAMELVHPQVVAGDDSDNDDDAGDGVHGDVDNGVVDAVVGAHESVDGAAATAVGWQEDLEYSMAATFARVSGSLEKQQVTVVGLQNALCLC